GSALAVGATAHRMTRSHTRVSTTHGRSPLRAGAVQLKEIAGRVTAITARSPRSRRVPLEEWSRLARRGRCRRSGRTRSRLATGCRIGTAVDVLVAGCIFGLVGTSVFDVQEDVIARCVL